MPNFAKMSEANLQAYAKKCRGKYELFQKTVIFHGRILPLVAGVGVIAAMAGFGAANLPTQIVLGALSGITVAIISGIFGGRVKKDVEDYEKFVRAKEKVGREIQAAKEEAIKTKEEAEKAEKKRKEAKVQMLKDFGYHESELDGFLSQLGKNPGTGVKELVAYMLERSRLLPAIRQSYEHTARADVPQPYLISLVFAPKLAENLQVDSRYFRSDLIEQLEEQALQTVLGGEGVRDPQKEGDFRAAMRTEICFADNVRNNVFHWNQKILMPFDSPVTYVVYRVPDEGGEPSSVKPFQIWQQNEKKQWERNETNVLLCDDNREIVIGPNQPDLRSALIDIDHPVMEDSCKLTALDLFNDLEVQKKLKVRAVRQIEPFVPTDIIIRSLKGHARLVGYWVDGAWNEPGGEYSSRLSTSGPNYLKKGFESLITAHQEADREENRLLAGFIADFSRRGDKFNHAVSSHGNFEVRRGPIAEGARIHKFFIKPLEGALTKFFRKPLGGGEDDHKSRENYQDFNLGREAQTKLEHDGFISLNFSECYLMTGGTDVALCLELDLGSPAVGEGVGGMVQYDEITLKLSLMKYALRVECEDYEYLEKAAAQGFIGRGRMQIGEIEEKRMSYLKLLEPPHVRAFRTGNIVKDLQDAHVLPAEIRADMVNTKGEPGGEILIFATPEYQTIEKELNAKVADGESFTTEQLLQICIELERFCVRSLEKGIVCSDFSLNDTMFTGLSLERMLERLQKDEDTAKSQPGLFIGDYGSYVYTTDFTRTNKISKGEYTAPEDWDMRLSFDAEAYQAFAIGALCLEVLMQQPGSVPRALSEQQSFPSPDEYESALREEVTGLLGEHFEAQVIDYFLKMLSYDPKDRPKITE